MRWHWTPSAAPSVKAPPRSTRPRHLCQDMDATFAPTENAMKARTGREQFPRAELEDARLAATEPRGATDAAGALRADPGAVLLSEMI